MYWMVLSGGATYGTAMAMLTSTVGFGIGGVFGGSGAFVSNGSIQWSTIANEAGRAAAHGTSNYLMSGFKTSAFFSGALGSVAGSITYGIGGSAGNILKSELGGTLFAAGVGGVSSKIGGGSFVQGAVTAATVHLVNHMAHNGDEKKEDPKKANGDEATAVGMALGTADEGLKNLSKSIGVERISAKLVTTGKAFGKLGSILGGLAVYEDYNDYSNGEISGARFSYHLGTTGAGIGAGAIWGGPAGLGVGAAMFIAEKSYDGLMWFGGELSKGATNFSNQISNRGISGR